MNLKESGEMYLETILILSNGNKRVRAKDVSDYMNYSKPSVSRAVGLLRDSGNIDVDATGNITLTESGRRIAETIYERHTVLTNLFVQMGVSESVAVEDACKVEHDISQETFDAIKRFAKK